MTRSALGVGARERVHEPDVGVVDVLRAWVPTVARRTDVGERVVVVPGVRTRK
jgi:hypothetical protein